MIAQSAYVASVDRRALVAVLPAGGRRAGITRGVLLAGCGFLGAVAALAALFWLPVLAAMTVDRRLTIPVAAAAGVALIGPWAAFTIHELRRLGDQRAQNRRQRRLLDTLTADRHAAGTWTLEQFMAWPRRRGHGTRLLTQLAPHLPADADLVAVARDKELIVLYADYGFQRWPAGDEHSRVMWRPAFRRAGAKPPSGTQHRPVAQPG